MIDTIKNIFGSNCASVNINGETNEFVDSVQIGSVATYLERTESAGLNLFVKL